jgi:hypothetical protein
MKAPIFVLFMLTGLISVSPAFAGYIPGIRPYTGFNYGGYKPSERSEYYKLKIQKPSTVKVQEEKPEPVLVEIKNSKMSETLKAIKLIPKENRIESNNNYTYIMNRYNSARQIWLEDNSEMINQGLLQDPGDASYYEKPLTEMEECIKSSQEDCDYQYKTVDGTHSQKEIDDATSSRNWLKEQNKQETIKQFLLILFCFGSLAGAIWVLKHYVLNSKQNKH